MQPFLFGGHELWGGAVFGLRVRAWRNGSRWQHWRHHSVARDCLRDVFRQNLPIVSVRDFFRAPQPGSGHMPRIVLRQFSCPACSHVVPRLGRHLQARSNVNTLQLRSEVGILPAVTVSRGLRTMPADDPFCSRFGQIVDFLQERRISGNNGISRDSRPSTCSIFGHGTRITERSKSMCPLKREWF
jgi:hypothetical protein